MELEQRGKCSSVRWTASWKQEDTGISAKHADLCFLCHQAAKLTFKLKSKEGTGHWSRWAGSDRPQRMILAIFI